MATKWLISGLCFAVSAVTACSGGGSGTVSSGGGNALTNSPVANKKVSELSSSERESFCRDLNAPTKTSQASRKQFCASIAASVERTNEPEARRTACKASYEECVNKPASTPSAPATDAAIAKCVRGAEALAACHATVGDLGRCFQSVEDAMNAMAPAYDGVCDRLVADGGADIPPLLPAASPICVTVRDDCPVLFPASMQ